MLRFVSGKLHNVAVTDKSLDYHGSIGVGADLLEAAQIAPFEAVDVINLSNGERWTTYAIPIENGALSLNGGGARLGERGDRCVILTYRLAERFESACVAYCRLEDARNVVDERFDY